MDKLKNAAIILLGMGEKCAADILKNLTQKEVESIIEIMNNIGEISEYDVIKALNEFFNDTKKTTGINVTSGTYIRNTLVSAVGSDRAASLIEGTPNAEGLKGFELLKWQPLYLIVDALEEEHPQIITVILMCMDSEKAAEILKWLPKDLSKNVIKRMTNLSPVSHYAMNTLSDYLEEQFTSSEKYKRITSDGINMAANIISYLDSDIEHEIMSYLTEENKDVYEKLQGKLFPFEKLAKMDTKSLQLLLSEVPQEDLVLALKGADNELRNVFFKNISAKTVDLIKDDLEASGPVKIEDVLAAQKRMIELAKQLSDEEKIVLPSAKTKNTIL
ncbi:flagellar motor switch protein FliG [Legionella nagasakiensis]|uniref:flagellar motor switch protein FliG n=1 Tax=Legionella nagasakiensis TaxID=535290 RepID=UPI00105670E2|nr:flagellar motor switch protein FliG [Legionella nagasakiensis]